MELPSFPLPPPPPAPPLAPPPSHTHHAINIRPPGDVCGYRDCPVGRDCFSPSALTPFGLWPIAFRYSRNVISLFSVPTPTLSFHTHPHWCLKNDRGVHPSHIFLFCCRDKRRFRGYCTREGQVPDVHQGEGVQQRRLA